MKLEIKIGVPRWRHRFGWKIDMSIGYSKSRGQNLNQLLHLMDSNGSDNLSNKDVEEKAG